MTTVHQALEHMIALIEAGMEYPEASTRTACKFRVDSGRLAREYDDHCAREG